MVMGRRSEAHPPRTSAHRMEEWEVEAELPITKAKCFSPYVEPAGLLCLHALIWGRSKELRQKTNPVPRGHWRGQDVGFWG